MAVPKTLFRRLKHFVFAFILVLYGAAASAPFINQSAFWFISILGIIFPWLFFAMIALLIYQVYRRSRFSFLVLALILLSWKSLSSTFGVHFFGGEQNPYEKEAALTVLSWNVSRWDQMRSLATLSSSKRALMLREILKENADVMCLHEFFEPSGNGLKYYQSNIEAIRAEGYQYYRFFPTSTMHDSTKLFGMAIFSKFPITSSGNYSFGNTPHSEGLMFTDILVNHNNIRLFTTHLESFKLGRSSYFQSGDDGVLSKSQRSIWSIRNAYRNRYNQMHLVKEKVDSSPHPVLLMGNFGDVPNSETYAVLSQGFQDAFLLKGSGFGATFPNIIPNLRLDYILAQKKIKVKNFKISKVLYSDHYPISAQVSPDF